MRSPAVMMAPIVFSGLVLVGCGAPSATTIASPAGAGVPASSDAVSLLARPLHLTPLAAGSPCPVSPIASVSSGVTNPRGKGPLYFGGPMPQGGFPFNKMVYVTLGATEPILLRGGQIDGAGSLKFSGSPADAMETAEVLPLPGETPGSTSWLFYAAILDSGPSNALYVYPATRGCYAIQVDAPTFEEEIILQAT